VPTAADISKAEEFARNQRIGFLPTLRMDAGLAGTDLDHCQRAHGLAETDPLKFDTMLALPIMGRLFDSGALYFQVAA
jgi:hypothetical protein